MFRGLFALLITLGMLCVATHAAALWSDLFFIGGLFFFVVDFVERRSVDA